MKPASFTAVGGGLFYLFFLLLLSPITLYFTRHHVRVHHRLSIVALRTSSKLAAASKFSGVQLGPIALLLHKSQSVVNCAGVILKVPTNENIKG